MKNTNLKKTHKKTNTIRANYRHCIIGGPNICWPTGGIPSKALLRVGVIETII